MEKAILAVGLLVFVGHLLAGLFKRTRIPDVLVLTLLGITLGPYGLGWVSVEQMGMVGSVFSAIALVVILFEGGVNMNLRAVSAAMGDTSRLTLISFTATLLITAALTQHIIGWQMAFILGGILAGTSSAVVIPMVSSLKLGDRTRVALSLESALTDVLCIVVVYALMQSMISGGELQALSLAGSVASKLVMASIIGFGGGLIWLVVLGKVRQIPNTQFTVFGLAFVLYGFAELMEYSGAIAALVLGITIANVKPHTFNNAPFLDRLPIALVSASERSLFGEAVFLVKLLFFVYLGINLPFSQLSPFLIGGTIVGVVYAARILIVLGSLPGDCQRRDAIIAAIMIPKGLAAAVLATLPLQAGLKDGDFVRDVAFAVVFESILLTSILVPVVDMPWINRFLQRTLFRRFADEGRSVVLPSTEAGTTLIDVFQLTAQLRAEADAQEAQSNTEAIARKSAEDQRLTNISLTGTGPAPSMPPDSPAAATKSSAPTKPIVPAQAVAPAKAIPPLPKSAEEKSTADGADSALSRKATPPPKAQAPGQPAAATAPPQPVAKASDAALASTGASAPQAEDESEPEDLQPT